MTYELDPEVVADLALRARTEHDSSRTRTANYAWSRPQIVAAWKCRRPGCNELVGVTEEAMHTIEVWSRELARRGEQPIDTARIVFCDACEVKLREALPDKRRAEVDRMAHVIRQLVAGDTQIQIRDHEGQRFVDERAALKQLASWGHPDVSGLEQSLATRNKKQRGKL